MLQFHVNGWNHRAVWGAHEKNRLGKRGNSSKSGHGKTSSNRKVGGAQIPGIQNRTLSQNQGDRVCPHSIFRNRQLGSLWDFFHSRSSKRSILFLVSLEKTAGEPKKTRPQSSFAKETERKDPEKWNSRDENDAFTHWRNQVYKGFPEEFAAINKKKEEIEKKKEALKKEIPSTFVMADLPKARESFVMVRGQYDNPGEKVSRGVPAFLPSLPPKPKDRDYNRLDLADWLVRNDHPLTSRVIVNRIWQQFFGTGLVKTSSDFGTQGELPSHPELLDWLAVQFMEEGWDFRLFIKRILTSKTYRQSSEVSPTLLEKDPDNRLLARGPRYRLDAEIVRDQALHLSGLLVDKVGGRGVMPYQPPNIWEPVGFGNSNTRYYKQGKGDDLYRRSLYTFYKRTAPAPFMSTFDAPNREQSCSGRGKSNTPMQALQLLNDVQHARKPPATLPKKSFTRVEIKIRKRSAGPGAATSRKPSREEIEIVQDLLNQNRKRYAQDLKSAEDLIGFGESEPDAKIKPLELAPWTLVANMILNLDEVVNKN